MASIYMKFQNKGINLHIDQWLPGGLVGGYGTGLSTQGQLGLLEMMAMFCSWTVVVLTHVYKFVKIHQTVDFKFLQFIDCKLSFNIVI